MGYNNKPTDEKFNFFQSIAALSNLIEFEKEYSGVVKQSLNYIDIAVVILHTIILS